VVLDEKRCGSFTTLGILDHSEVEGWAGYLVRIGNSRNA